MKIDDCRNKSFEVNDTLHVCFSEHKALEQYVLETGIPLVAYEEYDFGECAENEYW